VQTSVGEGSNPEGPKGRECYTRKRFGFLVNRPFRASWQRSFQRIQKEGRHEDGHSGHAMPGGEADVAESTRGEPVQVHAGVPFAEAIRAAPAVRGQPFCFALPALRPPSLPAQPAPDAPRRHAPCFVFSLRVRPLGRCSDCLVWSRTGWDGRACRCTHRAPDAIHIDGWSGTSSAALPGSRRSLPGRRDRVPLPPLS
jgi:hypothetical protein